MSKINKNKSLHNIATFIANCICLVLAVFLFTSCKTKTAELPKTSPSNSAGAAEITELSQSTPVESSSVEVETEKTESVPVPVALSPDDAQLFQQQAVVDTKNTSISYAPLKGLELTYSINNNGEKSTETKKTQIILNSDSNYIISLVSKLYADTITNYVFDDDGLRLYNSPGFSDGILVLPFELNSGETWDSSQLIRVENKPELTCGLNVPVAFVLTTGTETDTLSAYAQGLGLVASWNNATGEGEPTIILSEIVLVK